MSRIKRRPSFNWQLVASQFQGLQGRHPGTWPIVPRLLCALGVSLVVIVAGGWLIWTAQWEEMNSGQAEEVRKKQDFVEKVRQSGHLDILRQQKAQVQSQVEKLEQQLPGKSEMDALLSEINQAGINRGLQFELFKPGQVRLDDFYAELPIQIKLTGKYHALAAFTSDVANLQRIVTIDSIAISQLADGLQSFEGVIHTFRYLDKDELASQKKSAEDSKKRVNK
ncbi:MAG: Type pilus biosis protein PilO [Pseudomonadota bacterium]|jgi:type IV pilus assembly protein PilO